MLATFEEYREMYLNRGLALGVIRGFRDNLLADPPQAVLSYMGFCSVWAWLLFVMCELRWNKTLTVPLNLDQSSLPSPFTHPNLG